MKVITIFLKISLLMLKQTANLLEFEITIIKHGDSYDFENSEEVADDFLKMFVHNLNHLT